MKFKVNDTLRHITVTWYNVNIRYKVLDIDYNNSTYTVRRVKGYSNLIEQHHRDLVEEVLTIDLDEEEEIL